MKDMNKEKRRGIKAMTREDWKPLLALIPEIEKTKRFGTRYGGEENDDGTLSMPYMAPEPIVEQFIKVVYTLSIIIPFDWMSWKEGTKIVSDASFDFDTLNLITKCQLITYIVRQDRFNEGFLVSQFESGLMLKILKSLEKEVLSEKHS